MKFMKKAFGASPFTMIVEHTKQVHECVKLVRPLTDALLSGDYARIEELHHELSGSEHEADEIKTEIRNNLSNVFLMSVGRYELIEFLSLQDNVADAAEDYAVVLLLRKTVVPDELKNDLLEFVQQVLVVSDHLLGLSEELALLAKSAFKGEEAERVLASIEKIGEEEWKADKLQRKFARHYYAIEDQLDPVTIMFFDKYCRTLSAIANAAEKTAKFLRQVIVKP